MELYLLLCCSLAVLLFVLGTAVETGPTYRKHEKPHVFTKSHSLCSDFGQMAEITSARQHAEFSNYSLSVGSPTVWMPIIHQKYNQLTWTNVSYKQKDTIPYSLQKGYRCGFLDYTTDHIRNTKCSALWLGYICQTNSFAGQKSCEDLHVGHKQLKAAGDCFRIHFEKLNWYEARWRCKSEGHDLAILRNEDQRDELATKIRQRFDIFIQWHFWVGLRTSDWIWQDSGADITDNFVIWDWGQPKHHGDCVVAHKESPRRMYIWKTEKCTARHQTICQKRENNIHTTQSLAATKQDLILKTDKDIGNPELSLKTSNNGTKGNEADKYRMFLAFLIPLSLWNLQRN